MSTIKQKRKSSKRIRKEDVTNVAIQTDKISTTLNKDVHIELTPEAELQGNFEVGDKIDKIAQAAVVRQTGQKKYYILWQKRSDGIIPKNTWVDSDYLKIHDSKTLCLYLRARLDQQQ